MKPKIAICAKPQFSLKDTHDIAKNNGYMAVDWSIELNKLSLFKNERVSFDELLEENVSHEVRYHCPLDKFEIAHVNPYISKNSVRLLKRCIEIIKVFNAQYLTLHISGASSIEELNWDAAVRNLAELVDYGDKKGVTICLENLKSGWTSDPVLFSKLIDLSGAKVTFDIGHANSSVYAVSGQTSCLGFLAAVSDQVVNAHVYEAEDPYHIAPQDLTIIRPVLSELIKTQCDWWVVELDERDSIEETRSLLLDFLDQN